MTKLFQTFLLLVMLFVAAGNSYGQVTYTTSGLCAPNQADYFTTPLCWLKSGPECPPPAPASPNVPPVFGSLACPVNIVINHPVDIGTFFNLGTRVNLTVNVGGEFNISGNLFLLGQAVSRVVIDGGQLNVNGSVLLNAGSMANKTTLRIQTLNQGVANVGVALNLNNDTFVEIFGDDSGEVNAGSIELGQRTRLDILAGGRLTSLGNTRYNGNNAQINVTGFFQTSQLEITGGSTVQLNTLGNAKVIIENDLVMGGSTQISFGGDSEIDIGGNIQNNGGATITATENAKVFYCGGISNPPNAVPSSSFIADCRILPVDYVYIESAYSKESNAALLSWATSKEWENSRFEIEGSVNGIGEFVKIGEVQGMGWKDSITEYEYKDRNLPLIGGNVYYRLKQVDLNGEYSLSKVMSVKINGVQFTQGVWRAYPNPTDGSQFRISLLDPAQYNQEKITFRIIHPTSISNEILVDSENEMNEALSKMVGEIPKGIFVVELRWGQKIEHIKVLKKR